MIETAFALVRLQGHRADMWKLIEALAAIQWSYEHTASVMKETHTASLAWRAPSLPESVVGADRLKHKYFDWSDSKFVKFGRRTASSAR